MKITKKILAVVLSAILALSLFSVCASAAGTPNGDESMTVTLATNKESYSAGENVTVSLNIKCNYNVTTFRFPVMFDSEVYEVPTLMDVTGHNTCASGVVGSNPDASDYIPEEYDGSAFGCVIVQWTAEVANGVIDCLNAPDGELCLTFTLKTKSTAGGKTGTIFIPAESDLFYYQAMNDVTDAKTIYYLSADTCAMEFVPVNASVVGQSVALVPTAGSKAVVDEANGYVYGLATDLLTTTDIKKYVEATGGATLSAAATEFGYGTGTKLNLRVKGETVKSYTLIIFGDTNGDSVIDPYDLSTYYSVSSGITTIEDPVLVFASDLTEDEVIDISDLSIVYAVTSSQMSLDQNNPYNK